MKQSDDFTVSGLITAIDNLCRKLDEALEQIQSMKGDGQ